MNYNLNDLDDFDFATAAGRAVHRKFEWAEFLQPNVIHRTRKALVSIKISLVNQVKTLGENGEDDWLGRVHHKMRVIDSRMTEVNASIRQGNKLQNNTVHAVSQKYGNLAFELALALGNSDASDDLDYIFVEDISAREWLEKRQHQTMLKKHG
tara:strand:- start:38 stop:496 length:459 start_codon:yes stop_codon:yes gene_type:complete